MTSYARLISPPAVLMWRVGRKRWSRLTAPSAEGENGKRPGDPAHGEEVVSDRALGRLISAVENEPAVAAPMLEVVHGRLADLAHPPVLGVTGTGGAGKSSLVDELVRRFLLDFPHKHLAIVSVDPSKRRTGGALLGDRIRMNAVYDARVYMRSLATRQTNLALSRHIREVLAILKAAQFDLIILETSALAIRHGI